MRFVLPREQRTDAVLKGALASLAWVAVAWSTAAAYAQAGGAVEVNTPPPPKTHRVPGDASNDKPVRVGPERVGGEPRSDSTGRGAVRVNGTGQSLRVELMVSIPRSPPLTVGRVNWSCGKQTCNALADGVSALQRCADLRHQLLARSTSGSAMASSGRPQLEPVEGDSGRTQFPFLGFWIDNQPVPRAQLDWCNDPHGPMPVDAQPTNRAPVSVNA